jgi:small subunit ribosomal protein S17
MAEEEEKVEGASAEADDVVAEGASADAEAPSEEATEDVEEVAGEPAAEAVEAAQEAEADDAPVETVVPAAEAAEDAADGGGSADAEAPSDATAAAEAPAPTPAPTKKKKRLPRSERRQRTKKPRQQPAERRSIVRLEKPEHERGRSQERQGTVVSDAMEKTIVVEVHMVKAHPKYKKVVRRSTKFHAHDEQNQAKVGDVVRIVETRPLSKQKRWRLAEVLEVAK